MEKITYISTKDQNRSFEIIPTIEGKNFIIRVNECFRDGPIKMCKNIPEETSTFSEKDEWERNFDGKRNHYSGLGYVEKIDEPSKII